MSEPPSAATPAPEHLGAGYVMDVPAVSAPDVAALIARKPAYKDKPYGADDWALDAAAMLRRLSAPAGEDLPLVACEHQWITNQGEEWCVKCRAKSKPLTVKAATRIEQLSADVARLQASFDSVLARAEAAELLAQQRGERIASLEAALHKVDDMLEAALFGDETATIGATQAVIEDALAAQDKDANEAQ